MVSTEDVVQVLVHKDSPDGNHHGGTGKYVWNRWI